MQLLHDGACIGVRLPLGSMPSCLLERALWEGAISEPRRSSSLSDDVLCTAQTLGVYQALRLATGNQEL